MLRDGFCSLRTVIPGGSGDDDACVLSEPLAEAAIVRLHTTSQDGFDALLSHAVFKLGFDGSPESQGFQLERLVAVGVIREFTDWTSGPTHEGGWVPLTKKSTPVAWALLVNGAVNSGDPNEHQKAVQLQAKLKDGETLVVRVKRLGTCPRPLVRGTREYSLGKFLGDDTAAPFMLPAKEAGADVAWVYQLAVMSSDNSIKKKSQVDIKVLLQCKRTMDTAPPHAWYTVALEAQYLNHLRAATKQPRRTTRTSSAYQLPGGTKVHEGWQEQHNSIVALCEDKVNTLSVFASHPSAPPAFVNFPRWGTGSREHGFIKTEMFPLLLGKHAGTALQRLVFKWCRCKGNCGASCGCRKRGRKCSEAIGEAQRGCACGAKCSNALV